MSFKPNPGDDNPLHPVSIRLPKLLIEELDKAADAFGVPKHQIIQGTLDRYYVQFLIDCEREKAKLRKSLPDKIKKMFASNA
jgi:hypothetical protein